ncbi:phage portal protein [uncultured Microbulbifer sp.]|uniref:phage portal protein n=1 Tax=uncultured Microbulbifer sp. TaxID=348147 RepID=UPI0025D95C5C|nr:phage portal protein [uncultured Microbulbifer sp.]
MKIFGFEIGRKKALHSVPSKGLWRSVMETFAGAWQRNQEEQICDVLCYPTLYACISLIAQDIAKLPYMLMGKSGNIWVETTNPAYDPVLRKPNYFQTAQQFRESWVLSKLLHGNTYVLKVRDNRQVVTSLFVLDPCRVRPMVSDSGDIFYEMCGYNGWNDLPPMPEGLAERDGNVILPASEIIHDRWDTFHHPLIGVPPLCAANWPAVKNLKILKNATDFFGNGSNPGGILTAPAGMSDEDAKALKEYWNTNFSGKNSGKVGVIGSDMKFTSFAFRAADSQLVEQMRYSDEQIAQAFRIKPYKVGITAPPAGWKSDDINVEYHDSALSPIIEAMEDLLVEGLSIKPPLRVQLDAQPLWRMDQGKQAEVANTLVGGKISTPDEARARFNLAPTGGGDTLWGQHQDYPLGVLAERNDLAPVEPQVVEPEETEEQRELKMELNRMKAIRAAREAVSA